jgi:hypothetical protein
MSVLLFVVGAIMLIVGVGAIGFGIPINEFSFGNTLIVAGMTAAAGGLIVIALGAVVAQLRHLGEVLAAGAAARPAPASAAFEGPVAGRVPAGRIPFAGSSRPGTVIPEPPPVAVTSGPKTTEDRLGLSAEPILRNPEAPPLTTEDQPSLPPLHGTSTTRPAGEGFAPPPHGRNGSAAAEAPHGPAAEIAPEQSWQPPQPSAEARPRATNFDAMWPPTRPRPEPTPAALPERPREPVRDTAQAAPAEPAPGATEAIARAAENAPRAAAILKSGVVDGMGYTLYVDGSIEAELPQGTLRFASINDLRSHLEKNP